MYLSEALLCLCIMTLSAVNIPKQREILYTKKQDGCCEKEDNNPILP